MDGEFAWKIQLVLISILTPDSWSRHRRRVGKMLAGLNFDLVFEHEVFDRLSAFHSVLATNLIEDMTLDQFWIVILVQLVKARRMHYLEVSFELVFMFEKALHCREAGNVTQWSGRWVVSLHGKFNLFSSQFWRQIRDLGIEEGWGRCSQVWISTWFLSTRSSIGSVPSIQCWPRISSKTWL